MKLAIIIFILCIFVPLLVLDGYLMFKYDKNEADREEEVRKTLEKLVKDKKNGS